MIHHFDHTAAPVPGEAIGPRWAAFLRARFNGRHQAKQIARTFDVSIETARTWLYRETSPSAAVLADAIRRFGFQAATAICDWSSADIDAAIADLERRREELRAEIEEVTWP